MLLPSKATAALPAPKVSPMTPEPVMIASKKAVPKNSINQDFVTQDSVKNLTGIFYVFNYSTGII